MPESTLIPEPTPMHSPFVVRSGTLAAMHDAQQIKAKATQDAASLLGKAETDAVNIRLAAAQEAAIAAAALLGAATEAARQFMEECKDELAELAFAISNRLVGAMPRDDRTAMLVRTALAEHRDWSQLVVRVSSDTAPALRAALQADAVDVHADNSLVDDACILLHPAGRTELGPVAQFRALLAASADAVK